MQMYINGQDKTSREYIQVLFDKNGVGSTLVSSPTSSTANNNEIATTAFVQSRRKSYTKTLGFKNVGIATNSTSSPFYIESKFPCTEDNLIDPDKYIITGIVGYSVSTAYVTLGSIQYSYDSSANCYYFTIRGIAHTVTSGNKDSFTTNIYVQIRYMDV
jgi:hypothetical protein